MDYVTEKRVLVPYSGPEDALFWLLEALAGLILTPPDLLSAISHISGILTIIRENNTMRREVDPPGAREARNVRDCSDG
jgi:hypothetical protein